MLLACSYMKLIHMNMWMMSLSKPPSAEKLSLWHRMQLSNTYIPTGEKAKPIHSTISNASAWPTADASTFTGDDYGNTTEYSYQRAGTKAAP